MNGVDSSIRLASTNVQGLKNLGVLAVGRYLGYQQGWEKSLIPDEVKAIHDAGLAIFLIWESAPTSVDYFSYNKGVSDAQQAISEADYLSVPHGLAIYFAVDYDVKSEDMGAINEYFRGIRDGLGGNYLLGVYGSYTVMTSVQADKYYQTYAWSNGLQAPNHIFQFNNDIILAGISVDQDYVNEDAGLWIGSEGMSLAVAVLLNTREDFWSGFDVAVKNGNCAIFVRGSDKSISKDAMSAAKLIVVGGSTTGHPNEVLLSGNDKYDTAAAVKGYLG
jgi:hypothetical protein